MAARRESEGDSCKVRVCSVNELEPDDSPRRFNKIVIIQFNPDHKRRVNTGDTEARRRQRQASTPLLRLFWRLRASVSPVLTRLLDELKSYNKGNATLKIGAAGVVDNVPEWTTPTVARFQST
jgi:hypothetical protein